MHVLLLKGNFRRGCNREKRSIVAAACNWREVEWKAWDINFTGFVVYAVAKNGRVSSRNGDGVRLREEVVVYIAPQFCRKREEATVLAGSLGVCGHGWGILDAHLEQIFVCPSCVRRCRVILLIKS